MWFSLTTTMREEKWATIQRTKEPRRQITLPGHIIRLKGQQTQTTTFGRVTDVKKWIRQTVSAIREGRYFKTSAEKRYTLADMIDRYIWGWFLKRRIQIKS